MYEINSVGVNYLDLAKAVASSSQTLILMTMKNFDVFVLCVEAYTTAQENSRSGYMACSRHFPT